MDGSIDEGKILKSGGGAGVTFGNGGATGDGGAVEAEILVNRHRRFSSDGILAQSIGGGGGTGGMAIAGGIATSKSINGKADQEGGLSTTDALGLSSGAAPGTSAGSTSLRPWAPQSPGSPMNATSATPSILRTLGRRPWGRRKHRARRNVPGFGPKRRDVLGWRPARRGRRTGGITGLSAHELSLDVVCQAPAEENA